VYGRDEVALITAAEASAIDVSARDWHGVPERVLMENAGRAAAQVLDRLFPRGRVLALAGSGKNGGDALVAARVLSAWGRDVRLMAVGARPPDPALLHSMEIALEPAELAESTIATADVLIDGLLGTGALGAPRSKIARLIDQANASGRPILALDLPSGVDPTTGKVAGTAVRAAATVSFGWPKIGCLLHPARGYCGRLVGVDIGFPPVHIGQEAWAQVITPAWAVARLPARAPDGHKGTSGRLAILAGQEGMAGAAALAAEAARCAGAGLVRLLSVAANRVILQSLVPEATFADREALERADLDSVHALVAGPGIGAGDDVRPILDRALELTATRPVLLDADALNLFARDRDALVRLATTRPVVITPHPKELERLLGAAMSDFLEDRTEAARAASRRFNCIVVLKGQPTLVAAPDGRLLINSAGSSDLAAGGVGDQLSGVIGAFLAAGAGPLEAAGAGLYYSARAADLAARGRSLGPREISEHFHLALARPGAARSSLHLPFVTFDQPPRW
jgi:hydroxyethylthiazole kinase-like uncharacterized protein yjeF